MDSTCCGSSRHCSGDRDLDTLLKYTVNYIPYVGKIQYIVPVYCEIDASGSPPNRDFYFTCNEDIPFKYCIYCVIKSTFL